MTSQSMSMPGNPPSFALIPFAAPALGRLVGTPWAMSYDAGTETLPGTIAPDAHVEFVFQLGAPCAIQLDGAPGQAMPAASVYAQRHGALRLARRGANAILAFRATPAVATAILRRPLDEYWDRPVCLSELIGAEAHRLLDRLAAVPVTAGVAVLESWLVARLADWGAEQDRQLQIQRALLWRSGGVPVAALADAFGMSDRTLRRLCARQAGLSPKQLSMSGRILRACADLVDRPSLPLAEIALRAGFGDQPAFTNAFRHYVGMTPARLRAEPIVYCERP